jgi:hypothetical protein
MRARAKNFLSGPEGRAGPGAGRRSTPYGKDEDQLGYLVPCRSSIDMLPRVTLLSACSHLNQSSSSARTRSPTRELSPSGRCNARPPRASSSILTSQLSWPRPLNGLQRPQIAHALAFRPAAGSVRSPRGRSSFAAPRITPPTKGSYCRSYMPGRHIRGALPLKGLCLWCHPMASPLLSLEGCVQSEGGCS